jgi:hypothetical protein
MEGTEKPHTDKYKEIRNDWNYNASCMLSLLPVWELENFKRLIFVVPSVQVNFSHSCEKLYDMLIKNKHLLTDVGGSEKCFWFCGHEPVPSTLKKVAVSGFCQE